MLINLCHLLHYAARSVHTVLEMILPFKSWSLPIFQALLAMNIYEIIFQKSQIY